MAPRPRILLAFALGLAAIPAACTAAPASPVATPPAGTAGQSSSPPASSLPTPSAAVQTQAPVPSGHLAFPSRFDVELVPGRYWSAPPFELGFGFDVDQPGWIAGHLNAEFFDIQRDADGGGPEWPQSILGFGLPAFIRGGTDIPVSELTPAEAIAALRDRASLGASNVTELTLFGRPAVRVDLHTVVQSAVFGGPGGTFTTTPQLDVRIAFVQLGERLLAVIVQADAGDLDARWTEALPILESVELADPAA